jgi:hypothetical protein
MVESIFCGTCRFIKRVGWDAKLVNKSYPWIEKQIVHQPLPQPFQTAFRDSLLAVGISPYNGFTYDHLYGTKVGGTIFDRFGRRHSSAELLSSGNPQKLTVLVYATVQKILFDTSGIILPTYETPFFSVTSFGFGGPKGNPFGIVQRDFGCHLAGFERVWF